MVVNVTKINYKKVFFEIVLILSIALVVSIQMVSSAISAYGVISNDDFAKYRGRVDEIENMDYSKGRDKTLERRLDAMFAQSSGDEQFFNGLARAIYYCNIGFFNTAEGTFREIEYIAPNEEELLIAKQKSVLCERKQDGR